MAATRAHRFREAADLKLRNWWVEGQLKPENRCWGFLKERGHHRSKEHLVSGQPWTSLGSQGGTSLFRASSLLGGANPQHQWHSAQNSLRGDCHSRGGAPSSSAAAASCTHLPSPRSMVPSFPVLGLQAALPTPQGLPANVCMSHPVPQWQTAGYTPPKSSRPAKPPRYTRCRAT